jgi:ketosteroid isomerase-like protein
MMKALLPATVLLTASVLACDSRPATDQNPAPATSPATPTPPTPPATNAAPPATPDTVANAAPRPNPNPIEEQINAVTQKWNEALAKRDAKALEGVYAKNVKLYTVDMTREKALKTKSDAFAAAKDYTQSIAVVEYDVRKKDEPKALFNKKWTANGKENQVRASLLFTKEGGKWLIKEESDAPSDQRRARAAASQDSCESVVQKLAASTPEALRILGARPDPSKGHLSNGTRLGGGPPEQASYSVAIHETHDDHIVTLMWIDVDPKTGAMTSVIDDKPLKGSEDLVEKVKTACAAASR